MERHVFHGHSCLRVSIAAVCAGKLNRKSRLSNQPNSPLPSSPYSFAARGRAFYRWLPSRRSRLGVYHVDSGLDTVVTHPRELAEVLLRIGSAF